MSIHDQRRSKIIWYLLKPRYVKGCEKSGYHYQKTLIPTDGLCTRHPMKAAWNIYKDGLRVAQKETIKEVTQFIKDRSK